MLVEGVDYRVEARRFSPTLTRKGTSFTSWKMLGPAANAYLPGASDTFLCVRDKARESLPIPVPSLPVIPSQLLSNPLTQPIDNMENDMDTLNDQRYPDGAGNPLAEGALPSPPQGPEAIGGKSGGVVAHQATPEEAMSGSTTTGKKQGKERSSAPVGGSPHPTKYSQNLTSLQPFVPQGSMEIVEFTATTPNPTGPLDGRCSNEQQSTPTGTKKRPRNSGDWSLLGSSSSTGTRAAAAKDIQRELYCYLSRLRSKSKFNYDNLGHVDDKVRALVKLVEEAEEERSPQTPNTRRQCMQTTSEVRTQTSPHMCGTIPTSLPTELIASPIGVTTIYKDIIMLRDLIVDIAKEAAIIISRSSLGEEGLPIEQQRTPTPNSDNDTPTEANDDRPRKRNRRKRANKPVISPPETTGDKPTSHARPETSRPLNLLRLEKGRGTPTQAGQGEEGHPGR